MSVGDTSFANERVESAVPADLPHVLALLDAVGLPGEGVEEHFAGFVVSRDTRGQVVGSAGVEFYDGVALLRSVAVAPELQRSGLGSRLAAAVIELAGGRGAREVVLLTTTAADFFSSRFGFTPALRSDYDERLAASPEWNLPRCSSAAFLRREI